MTKNNFSVFNCSVDVNESKLMVRIWDYQLVDILEEIVKLKINTELSFSEEWEDGKIFFIPRNEITIEQKEKLIAAFNFDEDFFEEGMSSDNNFDKIINDYLFGHSDVTFYYGSEGGRGESELVFDLSDTEYEHFMKIAIPTPNND